jgi:hypothetical protein
MSDACRREALVELRAPAGQPGVSDRSGSRRAGCDNKRWAGFTQWTYKFGEQLGLTAGARYTQDDKGSYPDQFDFAAPAVKQVPLQWYRGIAVLLIPEEPLTWEEPLAKVGRRRRQSPRRGHAANRISRRICAPAKPAPIAFSDIDADSIRHAIVRIR